MLRDQTYTRVITALKIGLPLTALALLSTMFMLSRENDPTANIPFSERMQDRAERQQITAPFFSGTTEDGSSLTIQARAARPEADTPTKVVVEGLKSTISIIDGGSLEMAAEVAMVDLAANEAVFSGDVSIVSSTGYALSTSGLRTSLSKIEAESLGLVTGSGPAGQFTAGKLIIEAGQDAAEVQMHFTGGVKMVYDPRN